MSETGIVRPLGTKVVIGIENPSNTLLDLFGIVWRRQDLNLPSHATLPGIFASEWRCAGKTVIVLRDETSIPPGQMREWWLVQGPAGELDDSRWQLKGAVPPSVTDQINEIISRLDAAEIKKSNMEVLIGDLFQLLGNLPPMPVPIPRSNINALLSANNLPIPTS
jgi:hypothetical protein